MIKQAYITAPTVYCAHSCCAPSLLRPQSPEKLYKPPCFPTFFMDQTPPQTVQFTESSTVHRYPTRQSENIANRPRSPYPSVFVVQDPDIDDLSMSRPPTPEFQHPIVQPSGESSSGEPEIFTPRGRMEELLRSTNVPTTSGGPSRRPRSVPAVPLSANVLPVSSAPSSRTPFSYEARRYRQQNTPRPSSSSVFDYQAHDVRDIPQIPRGE